MVIAEAAYLLDRRLGPSAEVALYDSVLDGGLRIESLTAERLATRRENSSTNTATSHLAAPMRVSSRSLNG